MENTNERMAGQRIDVQELASRLLRRKITRQRFEWPLTLEQTTDALTAAVMAEVRYRGGTYKATPQSAEVTKSAAEWLADGRRKCGLLMCGLPGNGKSTLMRAVASLVGYMSVPDISGDALTVAARDARDVARISRDSYSEFKKICTKPFLALDDLGIEPTEVLDYGNVISPIIELLSVRYNEQLPTMVTTNLTPRQIREKYGDRIADRFNEMMRVTIFENPSYRDLMKNQ